MSFDLEGCRPPSTPRTGPDNFAVWSFFGTSRSKPCCPAGSDGAHCRGRGQRLGARRESGYFPARRERRQVPGLRPRVHRKVPERWNLEDISRWYILNWYVYTHTHFSSILGLVPGDDQWFLFILFWTSFNLSPQMLYWNGLLFETEFPNFSGNVVQNFSRFFRIPANFGNLM